MARRLAADLGVPLRTAGEFDKWMFRDWWRHLKSRYCY
jgi:hypothetical protein